MTSKKQTEQFLPESKENPLLSWIEERKKKFKKDEIEIMESYRRIIIDGNYYINQMIKNDKRTHKEKKIFFKKTVFETNVKILKLLKKIKEIVAKKKFLGYSMKDLEKYLPRLFKVEIDDDGKIIKGEHQFSYTKDNAPLKVPTDSDSNDDIDDGDDRDDDDDNDRDYARDDDRDDDEESEEEIIPAPKNKKRQMPSAAKIIKVPKMPTSKNNVRKVLREENLILKDLRKLKREVREHIKEEKVKMMRELKNEAEVLNDDVDYKIIKQKHKIYAIKHEIDFSKKTRRGGENIF